MRLERRPCSCLAPGVPTRTGVPKARKIRYTAISTLQGASMASEIVLDTRLESAKNTAWWLYLLHGVAFVFSMGTLSLLILIINYVQRPSTEGTFVYSHHSWQIRTFWWGLCWSILGFITIWILVGFPILFATAVWMIYRLVKGWLNWSERKPMAIIAGQIPSKKVYEDEDLFAFHDIHPWAPVHFLLVPKLHIASMAQLGPEHERLMGRLMVLAPRLAAEQGCNPYPEGGFRMVCNTGAEGGQEALVARLIPLPWAVDPCRPRWNWLREGLELERAVFPRGVRMRGLLHERLIVFQRGDADREFLGHDHLVEVDRSAAGI
eukprot:gene17426-35897_t